ncbi:MAG: proteasome ATPase, partial [Actinomycetota bacterium]
MQDAEDPHERIEQYEKQVDELQTQIKFLEDEIGLLRRRLHSTPRQVKVLEERLLESKSEIARALSQNEKLVSTLRAEREKIEALKEEVEKLTKPPASFGVFLGENEDGSVDVFTAGRKMRVNVDPELERNRFSRGAEVILNEALNIVEVLDQDRQGEVVTIKELLGEDRVVVVGRGDEEMVAIVSQALRGQKFRAGDALLYDTRSGHVLE